MPYSPASKYDMNDRPDSSLLLIAFFILSEKGNCVFEFGVKMGGAYSPRSFCDYNCTLDT